MHNEYIRIAELDLKPEKGERKLVDDLAIVINESLSSNYESTTPIRPSNSLQNRFLRICP